MLPRALEKLVEEMSKIPSVGPRTAERYAMHLLRRPPETTKRIADALSGLHQGIKICPVTFAYINPDQEVSDLYSNPQRDRTVVSVVEQPLDIVPIESSGSFKGTYHVLGGALSPIDGIGPEKLNFNSLLKRIQDDNVKEIIIATNTNVEGESTAYYLQKIINEADIDVSVTRLARGLPAGLDLEFADHYTIANAMENRTTL